MERHMSSDLCLLKTLLPEFNQLANEFPDEFVAFVKFENATSADLDRFTPVYLDLADRKLRPYTWRAREGTVTDSNGKTKEWKASPPLRLQQFDAGQEKEFFLCEIGNGPWPRFREVMGRAWNCLPQGAYVPRPVCHFAGTPQLCIRDAAEFWPNFVANLLRDTGKLLAVDSFPDHLAEVAYLTVGLFSASRLAIEKFLNTPDLDDGKVAKLEKELPEELAKKEYGALVAEWMERLTKIGDWKASSEKKEEFLDLVRRFDSQRFAIAAKHGLTVSDLPYPVEIQKWWEPIREALDRLTEIAAGGDPFTHAYQASYWYRKLEGYPDNHSVTLETIKEYLIARHNLTRKEVGKMTMGEIAYVLRQDYETQQSAQQKPAAPPARVKDDTTETENPQPPDDPRLEQLLEACRNAELIIAGLKNVQDASHVQQDVEKTVKKVWEQAWWCSGVANRPPELIPIKNEVEARNLLSRLEEWAVSQRPKETEEVGKPKVAPAGHTPSQGPTPPNLLYWEDDRHELQRHELPPRLWSLVNYMWDRDKAPVQEVTKHVWEDEGLEVADATIRSTISRTNVKLQSFGISWTLSYRDGFVLKDR
jgi:hypothetical protein